MEFYEPTEWRGRPEKGIKQGSGGVVDVPDLLNGVSPYIQLLDNNERIYGTLIDSGVAPEMARTVLPQSLYTEVIATMSLLAVARIVKQRIDSHAQWEIQQYAKAMNGLMEPKFPVSWKALMEN